MDLVPGAFLVLTVQPLAAASPSPKPLLDVATERSDSPHEWVQPLYGGSDGPRVSIDRLIATARDGRARCTGSAQLYRTGALAYVDKQLVSAEKGFPGTRLFEELLDTVKRSVAAGRVGERRASVTVQVSL